MFLGVKVLKEWIVDIVYVNFIILKGIKISYLKEVILVIIVMD